MVVFLKTLNTNQKPAIPTRNGSKDVDLNNAKNEGQQASTLLGNQKTAMKANGHLQRLISRSTISDAKHLVFRKEFIFKSLR